MKILNISTMSLWFWGKDRGMPSVFFPQKELAGRGHEVYFICPLKAGEEKNALEDGVKVFRFDYPGNFRNNTYMPLEGLVNHLRATIRHNLNWLFFQTMGFYWGLKIGRQIKPDLVYAHGLTAAFPAFLVSRLLGAKFVIRLYGTRQLYWIFKNPWSRIKECRDYLGFKLPADLFIITNDGNHGDILARKLGVPEEKIKYWRNGVEDVMWQQIPQAPAQVRQRYKLSDSAKIIVSTARFIPDYRIDLLLETLPKVFAADPDAVAIIAGDGPQKDRLHHLAQQLGLSSRLVFTGILNRSAIKELLDASDVFVLLSRYHNCTNTMWEAMAAAKCIVTTRNEAITEVLEDNKNGILINEVNLNRLPNILTALLGDDAERQFLGRQAGLRAQEVLEHWDKRINREEELLRKLINNVV